MRELKTSEITAQLKKNAVSTIAAQWQVVPKTPLDYSFKEISNITEITTEESHRRHELPYGAGIKSITTAIRLPNNHLETLDNLFTLSAKIVESPLHIAWIDLSFNNLKVIDKELLQFPTLSTLYLHANEISDLSEIDKLVALDRLRTLTLHGNPVENSKGYRQYTISRLITLKHLDFCAITKQDKKIAKAYLDYCERKKVGGGDE
ncbi:Leucine-rich repeat-containing protein 51 [Rhizoclosmatium sp. JEL0117]|nr:Leucine-rich repeat-containing protein 51 [Rhizoclosmatium sp. JEL0117]